MKVSRLLTWMGTQVGNIRWIKINGNFRTDTDNATQKKRLFLLKKKKPEI